MCCQYRASDTQHTRREGFSEGTHLRQTRIPMEVMLMLSFVGEQHYLPPLLKSDSPPPERSLRELREGARRQLFNRPTHPRFKYADWKARNRPAALPEVDAEDLALEKRRYVYKHGLYVKHVASNRFTRVSWRFLGCILIISNPIFDYHCFFSSETGRLNKSVRHRN